MTALNSRKEIDTVLRWLINQATLDWIHRERLSVEWPIMRLNNEKVLSMLNMRRFSMKGTVYDTHSKQTP